MKSSEQFRSFLGQHHGKQIFMGGTYLERILRMLNEFSKLHIKVLRKCEEHNSIIMPLHVQAKIVITRIVTTRIGYISLTTVVPFKSLSHDTLDLLETIWNISTLYMYKEITCLCSYRHYTKQTTWKYVIHLHKITQ